MILTSLILRIHYSDRYSDDEYEYRHVILPKPFLKYLPKQFFMPDKSGTLRLLQEPEWRAIGVAQSFGWEHYEVHSKPTLQQRVLVRGSLADISS
jgi:cyclin-dependent kinase regulatory subunit CKS1